VVVIRAEVDETGHVRKEAVIESVHPIVDGAALAAVKQWTFEPKLCDGKRLAQSQDWMFISTAEFCRAPGDSGFSS